MIGGDRVQALILQCVGADFIREPDAPAFLAHVQYDALALALDHFHGATKLLTAIAAHGTEDIAGKTGTTNDKVDAWFTGFNRNFVVSTWVGFDNPHSLHEWAWQAALPIWMDFMKNMLQSQPLADLPQPPNIVTVRIDPKTGLLAYPGQTNAVFEMFAADHVPKQVAANASAPTNEETGNNDIGQLF